ncbi:MAG: hypothetical protein JOY71_17440 [Acetobacteraceae bacterium]|nr:hypothetical protein [Acetobacteraceae bacterium]MBV8589849.1 hypothetical protein [Acetobacteraceae bacterium]
MITLSRSPISISAVLGALMLLLPNVHAGAAENSSEPKVKVDNNSFKCITEMTKVRHFYVDNLLGNVEGTAAVAKVGKGDYPEVSVLQLIPTEAMVKQQKGFNPQTHDWEFFALDVDKNGTKIYARGFEDVNNRFGLNCFTCHKEATKDFDFICEQEHGCAPIPITRAMFGALQRTDPRCKNQGPVLAEDEQALKELDEIVKALKASVDTSKKAGDESEKK